MTAPPLDEVQERLHEVRVRGGATADEVVAVLAVLGRAVPSGDATEPSGYERWRRGRLRAISARATPATAPRY